MWFKFYASRLTSQFTILLVVLAAFFLRTYQLDSQSLRGDEAATVLYSAMPVSELWELSRITDPHPPLYYASLHPWQWLAGEEAWAMRFIGAAASTLAVAALYGLARRTLRRSNLSLLATFLLAVNPLQIWLAQDIRSYPFFTLLGLLSSWALWAALGCELTVNSKQLPVSNHQKPLRFTFYALRFIPWLAYILVTTACFYIHYYAVFLIAFQGLFVLLNFRRFWSQKWPWLISQAVILGLILPGLGLAYNFVGGEAAGGIDTIPVFDLLRLTFTSLLTGFTLDDAWGLWLSLLLVPVWLGGLVVLLRRDRLSGLFWTLFFAVPVLGVLALSIGRPFFKERFLIQAQPAFMVLLAAGLVALAQFSLKNRNKNLKIKNDTPVLPRSSIFHLPSSIFHPPSSIFYLLSSILFFALIFTNFLALRNYFTDPVYAKAPPWRLYHDYVSRQARPDDVMLTNFPEAAVSYYSPNDLPFYVIPAERDRPAQERETQTEQIAGAYRRVWFLPLLRQGFDEQGDVLNWLDRHADRVNQIFFPDYNLNLYLTPPVIEETLVSQLVMFEHGLRLRGYQIFDKEGDPRLTPPLTGGVGGGYLLTLQPGDKLPLSLYWQTDGPTDAPYTVFVHLIAADGFNRTGQDNQPVWGSYPTTLWQSGEKIVDKYTLTIPEGTPPGDHRLRLGWYDAATGQRLPVLAEPGQPQADNTVLNVVIRVESPKGE